MVSTGRGAPLLNCALWGLLVPKREIPNFAGARLGNELAQCFIMDSLSLIGLIDILNYTVTQHWVAMGPPLLSRALSRWLIPKREISNFPDASVTEELTKGNLNGPRKARMVTSFIELHCYLSNGFEGVAPLLSRASIEWIIPIAECRISPG